MRFALSVPPFGELADPHAVAELARQAESAGWDGFFVWDHLMRADDSLPVADPWITLAAVALATTRVRIGPMVTPLARRRVAVVARQTVTLDHLSRGRLTLGVGLGNDRGRELSAFGEITDARERAARLDASLGVLTALWSGERVSYDAEGVRVDDVRFLPRPVQQPRIPIWVGGEWPNRAPLRRAAAYDGYYPVARPVGPQDVAEIRRLVTGDVIVQGRTSGGVATYADGSPADLGALADAGATWWMEAVMPDDPVADVRALVAAGPPRG